MSCNSHKVSLNFDENIILVFKSGKFLINFLQANSIVSKTWCLSLKKVFTWNSISADSYFTRSNFTTTVFYQQFFPNPRENDGFIKSTTTEGKMNFCQGEAKMNFHKPMRNWLYDLMLGGEYLEGLFHLFWVQNRSICYVTNYMICT